MSTETKCPECNSENIYADGALWVCPECFHEWNPEHRSETALINKAAITESDTIRDANGKILADGDSVTVIKELRVKGSSAVVKVGTKVRNIRLVDSSDGHDIACKIEGIGSINLKSSFVRKT